MSKSNPKELTDLRLPDGWPRWLWLLVLRLVTPQALIALREKEGVMRGISDLAHKLDECRKEKEEWRQRAFSAERVISHELREALRAGLKRHDTEHSTCLGWHI